MGLGSKMFDTSNHLLTSQVQVEDNLQFSSFSATRQTYLVVHNLTRTLHRVSGFLLELDVLGHK